jgi:hypothetical protein
MLQADRESEAIGRSVTGLPAEPAAVEDPELEAFLTKARERQTSPRAAHG